MQKLIPLKPLQNGTHEEHVQNLTKSLVVTNKEEPELTNKLENHDMPKNTDGSLPLICSQLSYMINRLIQSWLHFHRKPSLKKKYKIRTQCAILKDLVSLWASGDPQVPQLLMTGKLYTRLLFLGIVVGLCEN